MTTSSLRRAVRQSLRAASFRRRAVLLFGTAVLAAGCAGLGGDDPASDARVAALLKDSFSARGEARLDRLDQSDLQLACSQSAASGQPLPPARREALQKAALDTVRYPADGRWLGNWREGERIAQNGRGLQFSDAPGTVAGGNCYACHQLAPQELSYGNIGPSLLHYGKYRGQSEPILRYTWARLWNAHAFNACNAMPRYGAAGILSEEQIRHLMALLLDPASPVNQ